MGNIDFGTHALFSAYVVLLLVSGTTLIGLVAVALRPLGKALNLLFGVAFVVYGAYLGWVGHGTTYVLFFAAFLLPLALAFSTVRSGLAKRDARRACVVVFVPERVGQGSSR